MAEHERERGNGGEAAALAATDDVTVEQPQSEVERPVTLSNKQKRKLRQQQESDAAPDDAAVADALSDADAAQPSSDSKRPRVELATRKLLIFDLNHVLLDRKPFTSQFTLRPHVAAFLLEMSRHFTLAVWSSMKKSTNSRELVKHVFQANHPDPAMRVPYLFSWFQNRCHPIYHSDGTKPTFLKNLSLVWREYPEYSAENTVIVDDSIEKCVNNPPFSLLIPRPFYITEACTVWSAATESIAATADHPASETMQATQATVYLATDAVVDAAANDCELRDDGALSAYLRAMAQHEGSVEDFVTRHGAYDASVVTGVAYVDVASPLS